MLLCLNSMYGTEPASKMLDIWIGTQKDMSDHSPWARQSLPLDSLSRLYSR